jgi:hypothetical protein
MNSMTKPTPRMLCGANKETPSFQSLRHHLRHQLIECRAYDKWKARGCPTGTSLRDWLDAEAELNGGAKQVPVPACPYQVQGRLISGQEAQICTLAEGSCSLQVMWPTTGGRHTAICTLPVIGASGSDGQPEGAQRRLNEGPDQKAAEPFSRN